MLNTRVPKNKREWKFEDRIIVGRIERQTIGHVDELILLRPSSAQTSFFVGYGNELLRFRTGFRFVVFLCFILLLFKSELKRYEYIAQLTHR